MNGHVRVIPCVVAVVDRVTNMRWSTGKLAAGITAAILVIVAVSSHHGSRGSSSSSGQTQSSRPSVSETTSAASPAHIVMLHGRGADNSCSEEDSEARIYVSFTLRNTGDQDGTVNPWATFDYSDGGNSTESYDTNYGHDLTVPAHSEVDATFYHTFNPQQHYMIRCAGYPDLSSDTAGYYLPMS
jgi:hypothetical protein